MATKSKGKLNVDREDYRKLSQKYKPKPNLLANVVKAFLIGGSICLLGQAISVFYMTFFDFTEKTAGDPTVATLIFLSALLTALGVYDRLGQFAGAGSAVPVTGLRQFHHFRRSGTSKRRVCSRRGRQHVQTGRFGDRFRCGRYVYFSVGRGVVFFLTLKKIDKIAWRCAFWGVKHGNSRGMSAF